MTHLHANANPQHLLLDASPQAITLPHLLQTYRLHLFYGDLHNHTGYSDGLGRPAEALRQMRARGLHFAAITDHGEFFDRETSIREAHKWAATAQQVAMHTGDDFLAIRGFEWSSPRQGHSNVWGSEAYTAYHDTGRCRPSTSGWPTRSPSLAPKYWRVSITPAVKSYASTAVSLFRHLTIASSPWSALTVAMTTAMLTFEPLIVVGTSAPSACPITTAMTGAIRRFRAPVSWRQP
jgi:hypothetical protein